MIKISPLSKDKIHLAAELEKACLDTAWSKKAIEDFLASGSGVYLCAEREGTVCGILSATVAFGEAEIENIAVDKSLRRLGVGRCLINALKSECTKMFLLVNSTNLGAIGFYNALGFEKVGIRKGYYKGIDAFIMALKGDLDENFGN